MRIPRWMVYPALLLIATLIIVAIPRRSGGDPFEGATGRGGSNEPGVKNRRVVVLGIDGMDPNILKDVIAKYPDRMPNFRRLIAEGDGIQSLLTSTPPQSPVAWSNFITGLDSGGHGVFDFIHRDPVTRALRSPVTIEEAPFHLGLPGDWQIPIGGDSSPNRTGEPFWGILRDHGVPADVWRMPINFPVESSDGVSFPGMLTPAMDSAYGECSFYTTDPMRKVEIAYSKIYLVQEYGGRIDTSLVGPPNPFKDGDKHEQAPLVIHVDREAGAAVVDTGSEKVVLRPGEWSDFLRVNFDLLPLGAESMSGIVRFYLRSIEPELELYASPVDFDPESPAVTISEPEDASAELARSIGRYYTQGMAEDVNALKYGVLDDVEFMQQTNLVFLERRRMLDYALDRYVENDGGGLLFFYFSTIDLCCHMMWRHYDAAHPAHDAEFAAKDSSAWSGREGSKWADTVHDLYLRMDPVLGQIRERIGDKATLIVMSDHGFAPYRRKFSLNTWLLEEGYLVLREGRDRELARDDPRYEKVFLFDPTVVDWSRTRAYGMGFNGLYLNLAGRERDNPDTPDDESGIVDPADAPALLAEIEAKLLAIEDSATGVKPVLRCDLATEVYHGPRLAEAPDMVVGYNAGYGNSDPSSSGRIPHAVLEDNTGGTFNGSHLMAPEVVSGLLLSNRPVRDGAHGLQDLTVEILAQYGISPPEALKGHPVLE